MPSLDPLPTYAIDQGKELPTPHELRHIYDSAQAAKPILAAVMPTVMKLRGDDLEADTEAQAQLERAHKATNDGLRWLTASMRLGSAWLGSAWEPQARAMLEALPRLEDVGRLGVSRTLYGLHGGEDGQPVVVVVAFDFVGVPHDIRACRPRPQEPPCSAANRATYDHTSALWVVRDTYAPSDNPCRQWVMEPCDADATDALAARLLDVVRANPTPSHISLLRAQQELANIAVGHTPPDQAPTFDALASIFPQIKPAKAKAQAYALTTCQS